MAVIPLAAEVIPPAALMFAVGVLPFNALAIIAILGQQIGGAMSTVTLSGRRIRDELALRHCEVEAAVALGFAWHGPVHSWQNLWPERLRCPLWTRPGRPGAFSA